MRTRIIQNEPPEPPTSRAATQDGPPQSRNLAARMGRWSSTHWKKATLGWVAFVVLSVFVSAQLPLRQISQNDVNVGESRAADRLIDEAQFNVDKNGKSVEKQQEFVLLQSKTLTVSSPRFRAAIADALKTVDTFPQVSELESPLTPGHTDLVSSDRHSALVRFTPKGTYEEAKKYIDSTVTSVATVVARHPGSYLP